MTTTLSVLIICHHAVSRFFLVMRNFKIYLLSNFKLCNKYIYFLIVQLSGTVVLHLRTKEPC